MSEELKTLKGIGEGYETRDSMREKLKAEAIKWVKECEHKGYPAECRKGHHCLTCQRTMKMNNITEKELENE